MKQTPQRINTRSKYENSSKKIKQLYEEFESLKQRISTPVKHKRQAMVSLYENPRYNYSTQFKAASLSFNTNLKREDLDLGAKTAIDHEMRVFLKNSFQKFLFKNISNLQRQLQQNVEIFEGRLMSFCKILSQVKRLMMIKKDNIKSIRNLKCNCKWKGQEVKQIEAKYEKKLEELKSSYESKISLLVKESNQEQTSGSSNSKRFPKEAQEQFKVLEQKILLKEGEIIEQQKEVMRLRKINDQKDKILYEKESMLMDLMKQTQQKNVEIVNHKNMIEKLKKHLEQKTIELDKRDHYQEKIKIEIEALQEKNQALESELKNLKTEVPIQIHEPSSLRNSRKQKGQEWDFSEIQQQQLVHSDYQDQQIIGNSLKIDPADHLAPLRHSHFIQTNTKKRYFELQTQVKELESELQLVVQENRVLKSKKDQFEQQVKQNENDEEKFQMQSQILRDELKRVNGSLRNLDECATIVVQGGKLGLQKFESLQNGSKFKQAYLKKNPMRSMSVKKK